MFVDAAEEKRNDPYETEKLLKVYRIIYCRIILTILLTNQKLLHVLCMTVHALCMYSIHNDIICVYMYIL